MPRVTRTVLAALPVLALLAAGCIGNGGSAPGPVRAELLVSPTQLAAMRADPDVVVLQVERDSATFVKGHLPGARFLPLSAIVVARDGVPNELPPAAALDSTFRRAGITGGERVVIAGEPLAAARAFFTLDQLGHPRVAMLDGGLPAWRREGRFVQMGSPSRLADSVVAAVRAAPRGMTPRAGVVVDAQYVLNHIADPRVALVDARPPAEYSGASPGDGIPRAGHIPSAGSLFWKTLVASDSLPALRDTAALRTLFTAAGAAPGDTVVTYCRTGIQASFAYFVARYLGYPVKMYDGSFIEWSNGLGYPVERPKTP